MFADAPSFLEAYQTELPGVLILDLDMPGMSGLERQRGLKERGVVLPVIFLSGHANVTNAVKAVKEARSTSSRSHSTTGEWWRS